MRNEGQRDKLDQQLTRALRRIRIGRPLPEPTPDEPSDDRLLLLIEDQLPPDERREVEQLLERCPYSADRVEVLREVLEQFDRRTRLVPDMEAEAADATAGRAARLVFSVAQGVMRWLRGTDDPVALAPLAMATRGGPLSDHPAGRDSFYQFERRFGDWDAVIKVESVPSHGVDLRLELRRDGQRLDGGRAELRRRGKLLESVRVREGVAGFTDLAADRYELAISGPNDPIGELTLELIP